MRGSSLKYSSDSIRDTTIGILGIIISVVCVAYLAIYFDFKKAFITISEVQVWYVFGMVGIYLSTFAFRTWRWELMFEVKKTFSTYFKAIILGFAGNNLLPARGGEFIRMEYFKRIAGQDRLPVLASIMLEKVLDAIVLISILMVILFSIESGINDTDFVTYILKSVVILFGTIIALILSIRFYGQKIICYFKNHQSFVLNKVGDLIRRTYRAIEFLDFDLKTLKVIILGFFIWVIEGGMYVLGISAFNLPVDPVTSGYLALVFVNFGILIPSSPGYIGVFQAMVLLALTLLGIEEQKSLGPSILIHSCQFIPITILGLFFFFKKSVKASLK